MKHQVKIETLTPVHTGSGDKKILGIDFLHDEDYIYFLDLEKIGNALNIAECPAVAQSWSTAVIKGKQEEFLNRQGIDIKHLSRRVPNYVDEFSDQAPSISTQMRDARGLPYIPGTSLKGAIRTVVFAAMAASDRDYPSILHRSQKEVNQWSRDFFGGISNDPFRHLHVGDAFFGTQDVGVTNTVQIKKSKNNPHVAAVDTIKQYIEILFDNSASQFSLRLDADRFNQSLHGKRPQFTDVHSLFKLINKHTLKLVESELKIWDQIKDAEAMCETLAVIKDEIDDCKAGKCVMRLGNASGKRFVTGGVLEGGNGGQLAIPKTRRIEQVADDDGEFVNLLGFVKLTVIG